MSDFDRFIFKLTLFHFFYIYLRISVYLLGRTLSSPTEATTEPWKTTKKQRMYFKKIHSICNISIRGAYVLKPEVS